MYFWFFGVLKNSNGAAYELKNFIMNEAVKTNTHIYVETAMEKNKLIYERYGFKTFHHWEDNMDDVNFWFMKWIPLLGKSAKVNH